MYLARFHCTAWKRTLIVGSLPPAAFRQQSAVASEARSRSQAPLSTPGRARACDGRTDVSASSAVSRFQPAAEHERPEQGGGRQKKDACAQSYGHWMRQGMRHAEEHECNAGDEARRHIERKQDKHDRCNGGHPMFSKGWPSSIWEFCLTRCALTIAGHARCRMSLAPTISLNYHSALRGADNYHCQGFAIGSHGAIGRRHDDTRRNHIRRERLSWISSQTQTQEVQYLVHFRLSSQN